MEDDFPFHFGVISRVQPFIFRGVRRERRIEWSNARFCQRGVEKYYMNGLKCMVSVGQYSMHLVKL